MLISGVTAKLSALLVPKRENTAAEIVAAEVSEDVSNKKIPLAPRNHWSVVPLA